MVELEIDCFRSRSDHSRFQSWMAIWDGSAPACVRTCAGRHHRSPTSRCCDWKWINWKGYEFIKKDIDYTDNSWLPECSSLFVLSIKNFIKRTKFILIVLYYDCMIVWEKAIRMSIKSKHLAWLKARSRHRFRWNTKVTLNAIFLFAMAYL